MERWSGSIAAVTGASSGIGAAAAVALAKAGLTVIGLARRVDRVNELSKQLIGATGKIIGYQCDVTDNESVKKAFNWIEEHYGGVQILVNSAGVGKEAMILEENNEDDLNLVIDTNTKGTINAIKAAYRHMKKYDSYGHIVNINSIAGHSCISISKEPKLNVYAGSKHFVTATTEVLRQELNSLQNRKVRVSSISPGLTDTEIFDSAGFDTVPIKQCPMLAAADVAQAILFMLSVPEHVQIHELIIKPVGEAI